MTQFSAGNSADDFDSTNKNVDWWAGPDLTPNGYESNARVSFRAYLTLKTSLFKSACP
jgi:hypothetical protein